MKYATSEAPYPPKLDLTFTIFSFIHWMYPEENWHNLWQTSLALFCVYLCNVTLSEALTIIWLRLCSYYTNTTAHACVGLISLASVSGHMKTAMQNKQTVVFEQCRSLTVSEVDFKSPLYVLSQGNHHSTFHVIKQKNRFISVDLLRINGWNVSFV